MAKGSHNGMQISRKVLTPKEKTIEGGRRTEGNLGLYPACEENARGLVAVLCSQVHTAGRGTRAAPGLCSI